MSDVFRIGPVSLWIVKLGATDWGSVGLGGAAGLEL